MVLTFDSDKNCEQRNSFQSDWITSRMTRKTRCLVYRDYCLNEIDQIVPKACCVVECGIHWGGYQVGQKEGLEKRSRTAMEVVLFENEIPKESLINKNSKGK